MRQILLSILPALVTIACGSDPIAPDRPIGGAFAVISYDGRPVPVDLGPLPTRSGASSSCHLHFSHGFLILEPDYRVYHLEYHHHASCDDRLLSRTVSIGVYDQAGSRLDFTDPAVVDSQPDLTFSGRIQGATIVLPGVADGELVFANTGVITTY